LLTGTDSPVDIHSGTRKDLTAEGRTHIMIKATDLSRLMGVRVVGADGQTIGTVGQFYVDPYNGEPLWATVRTGLFGTAESFVPLHNAIAEGDGVRVAYAQEVVKDAPRVHTDGALNEDEESELYRYYDLQASHLGADIGTPESVVGTVESTEMRDVDREAVRHAPVDDHTERDVTFGWKPTDDLESRSQARLHRYVRPDGADPD
jgi:hypothetical protein